LRYQHEARLWTAERVVLELRAWALELGRAPTATEAHREGAYVPLSVAQREFGTWSAALTAAGFDRAGDQLELCREIAARYQGGESSGALAAEYGCSSGTIANRVRSAGGRIRSPSEAQRARAVPATENRAAL